MAEASAKVIQQFEPRAGTTPVWFSYIKGVAANSDTFTVTGLTTVLGAFLISTTGTVGAMTFATNVITITNGGGLTWTGIAWGNP